MRIAVVWRHAVPDEVVAEEQEENGRGEEFDQVRPEEREPEGVLCAVRLDLLHEGVRRVEPADRDGTHPAAQQHQVVAAEVVQDLQEQRKTTG